MEADKDEATLTGWQYPLVAGAGILVILGYLIGTLVFLGYIMFLISRLYLWINQFAVEHGLFWGAVLGILALIGVLLATILAVVVLVFAVNRFQELRLKKIIAET